MLNHELSFANINTISSFCLLESALKKVDSSTLVIFDVDHVIIMPTDEHSFSRNLDRKKIWNNLVIKHSKKDAIFLRSITVKSAEWRLVDPYIIKIFSYLKNKEIPTIALTSHRTGRYGIIEKMENLRIKELKDFGIDFTKLNSLKGHLSINKFKNINGIPMLKNGVILTAEIDKATILEYILHKKNYYPKQIIFIDDQIRNLEAIQKLCNKLKIKFQGFHYIAASLMKVELIDKDLERLRFEILEDKNIWLSYEELRKIKNKEFK